MSVLRKELETVLMQEIKAPKRQALEVVRNENRPSIKEQERDRTLPVDLSFFFILSFSFSFFFSF